jgi:penicillin-binding protein 1A
MIIIVKQMGLTTTLALDPESAAAFIAEEVRTGRILAMQGGFDVAARLTTGDAGQTPAGLRVQADRLCDGAENGMTRPRSSSMHRSASGRARASATNASATWTANMRPKTMRWGVEQSRNLMTCAPLRRPAWPKSRPPRQAGVGRYDNYLSMALVRGVHDVLKLD